MPQFCRPALIVINPTESEFLLTTTAHFSKDRRSGSNAPLQLENESSFTFFGLKFNKSQRIDQAETAHQLTQTMIRETPSKMNNSSRCLICLTLFLLYFFSTLGRLNAQDVAPPKKWESRSARECALCHFRWIDTFYIDGRGSDLVDYTTERYEANQEMCFSCHDGSVMDSRHKVFDGKYYGHKAGAVPPPYMRVPTIFPLDKDGKLQCSTCHTAHGTPSGPGVKDSVFLRMSNRNSAMCRACHTDKDGGLPAGNHPIDKTDFEIPKSLITLGGKEGSQHNQLICESCHTAHGSRNESFLLKTGKDSGLCLECHPAKNPISAEGGKKGIHPINVQPITAKIPQTLLDAGAKLGFGGQLICQTCHKVHNNNIEKNLLALTKGEDYTLCFACHADKQSVVNTKHNLKHTNPAIKNLQGNAVAQGGVCSACHLPHKPARDLKEKNDIATQLCLSCHGKGEMAEKVTVLGYTHPLNVEPFAKEKSKRGMVTRVSPDEKNFMLPLYGNNGFRVAKGNVRCSTCHDPHRWRAGSNDGETRKEVKGDGTSSFLRKPSPTICSQCHSDKFSIAGSKHDFDNLSPDDKNNLKEIYADTGLCGTCHMIHSKEKRFLRANEAASKSEGLIADVCIGCHSQSGVAKKKAIGEHSHPIDVTLFPDAAKDMAPYNTINVDLLQSKEPRSDWRSSDKLEKSEAWGGYSKVDFKNGKFVLPLYDKAGLQNENGQMTCSTCHDPHQWYSDGRPQKAGRDLEGDRTTSFLRLEAPTICGECHYSKIQIAGSKHDIASVAAQEHNTMGQSPSESGVCGTCHAIHNGQEGFLWGKTISTRSDNNMRDMCLSCHNKDGAAQKKPIYDYSHPINVSPASRGLSTTLPLFDPKGELSKTGLVSCHTCHDPHRPYPWSKSATETKDAKETAKTSFLRLGISPSSTLCANCHVDKLMVIKTDHDLRLTAPTAKNAKGRTVAESGVCGACHSPHNNKVQARIWAQEIGEGDTAKMEKLCLSCHYKGGPAESKIPKIFFHPSDKLVISRGGEYPGDPVYPLFDPLTGERKPVGNIACPACHMVHQWSPSSQNEGPGHQVEGDATNSFLRAETPSRLCSDCHGQEALFRFKFFHEPDRRKLKKSTGVQQK